MPLEPNLATVGGVLVAVVLATMAGGLIGRRFRTWREHHAARRALAAMARNPGGASAPAPAATDADPFVAATAAASATHPTATAATGVPDATPVVGQSYLARRLAGAPPPVVTRRPSTLSPALEARGGRPFAPPAPVAMPAPIRPGRRRRRLAVASALIVSLFAVGIVLGIAGTSRVPARRGPRRRGHAGSAGRQRRTGAGAAGRLGDRRARRRHRRGADARWRRDAERPRDGGSGGDRRGRPDRHRHAHRCPDPPTGVAAYARRARPDPRGPDGPAARSALRSGPHAQADAQAHAQADARSPRRPRRRRPPTRRASHHGSRSTTA